MINKIKELRKKINDPGNPDATWDKVMLIDTMAKYLIEEHERHEQRKESIDNVETTIINAVMENKKCERFVEVGQIWRYPPGGQVKVYDIRSDGVYLTNDSNEEFVEYKEDLISNAELVTMRNIKVGEWCECTKQTPVTSASFKYRFVSSNKVLTLKDHEAEEFYLNGIYTLSHFKPCLPPVEKNHEPSISDVVYEIKKVNGTLEDHEVRMTFDEAVKCGKHVRPVKYWNDANSHRKMLETCQAMYKPGIAEVKFISSFLVEIVEFYLNGMWEVVE